MNQAPRHQCLIYSGKPLQHLAALANHVRRRLSSSYRCVYLNSPRMVSGLQAYLEASGLNVTAEVSARRLVLNSDREHLIDGVFDPKRMLELLEQAYVCAIEDGYVGLWASGDMAWEFGDRKDFSTLLEYERGLEALFQKHPTMCGVCQYHADMLPHDVLDVGLRSHPALYVNDMLSRINPDYQPLLANG